MNAININKINTNQKDILKGQKILAAIYMVTSHLGENDPIRQNLRTITTAFVCASHLSAKDYLLNIETLLGAATFSGVIGEKNSSIILYEIRHFSEHHTDSNIEGDLKKLFSDGASQGHSLLKDNKKTSSGTLILSSHRPLPVMSQTKNLLNKGFRQDKILSFINDRKSAVIKDIVSLFPDVSEKTVQRELNALINEGKITKRGSKRWSMYMAVNSLL